MANKVSTWFKALSTTGKAVVIGAAGTGLLVTSAVAMNGTGTPPPPQPPPAPEVVVKEEVVRTEVIPFESQETQDSTSPTGTRVVVTAGVNGEKTFSDLVEYTDGKETKRTPQPEKITKQPTTQVTKVGTKPAPPPPPPCDTNYTGGCVPVVSYDLDCPDIGFRVYVVGYDKHGFDGNDNDGIGCESY